jgi:hypothetical protein
VSRGKPTTINFVLERNVKRLFVLFNQIKISQMLIERGASIFWNPDKYQAPNPFVLAGRNL